MKNIFSRYFLLVLLRVSLGFVFLWAFLDKTFGFGFSTASTNAWVNGGSPTAGFLANSVQGPFVTFFTNLSGQVWVDWVFMAGLLFVGITLLINKFVQWGGIAGAVMMLLMYLSLLWPSSNPIIDEHIIYAILLLYIARKGEY